MKTLRDQYCVVGVGETEYSRASGRTTRAMAVEAIRRAILDAGLTARDVDGMLDYQGGDSTLANHVAPDLGIRLNFYMDVMGGGSSTEALIGLAMGAIEAGMCNTVAIYRSMNGYSEFRIGGTGARAAQPVRGLDLAQVPFGMRSAGQNFALTFMRHMYEYGTTSAQVARVKVAHSQHASQNPKALLKERVTVEDVVGSRWIVKPLHLLDCCLETDNATCLIVTSAERARDLKRRPVYIMGVAGRVSKPRLDFHWAHGPITRVAGYYAKDIVFGQAGIGPEDVDVTGSYDAFTVTDAASTLNRGWAGPPPGSAIILRREGAPVPQPLQYRGMTLIVPDNDSEWTEFYAHARAHRLVVRKCTACGLMRYPPTHACPWCMELGWTWQELSGRGTIYSYEIVHHAIQPGFRELTPYPVVLVELDEQRGQPTPDEALRIIGNLVKPDLTPEAEANVAIGRRVRVIFQDLADHMALPQFTLADEPAPARVWRLPE